MKRRWLAALTAVALLVLNFFGVGYTSESTPETLKIVTWNIRHGNERLTLQRDQLKALDADVCFLQEVDEGSERMQGSSCLNILGRGLYYGRYFGGGTPFENGLFGRGMLTKKRLLSFEAEPEIHQPIVESGFTRGVLRQNGRTISLYNVHFSFSSDNHRAYQIAALADSFLADENPYKIIAGDFNLRDFSELEVFSEYGIVNSDETYYPTYQGLDWVTQAIDNVIYTDDTLRPLSAEMIVNGLSDHNALAVTFEFLDPEE
ncbi:MAG: endonuclease/exonuclease/phosphatase family protein [Oscillospiraceae bacterium]|nr:endonuclease/exonuclease/phosphatase family protein [Oscillospiraceae bacterium]